MESKISGRCECGKVTFTVTHPRSSVTVCHCGQCRRTSGHLWASTRALRSDLEFHDDSGLEWYASSDIASRGFCRHCGSSLFYQMKDDDGIGIAAGCLEAPSGLSIEKHIFTIDKGDYYQITDGKQQLEGW